MSRVEVTPLVPGELATSTDANATITSFEAACGAGDLGANNVRIEGVTRRTIDDSGDVVEMEHAAYFSERSSSGPVNNTTGTPAVVSLNLGTEDMETPDVVGMPVTARVMVHASLVVNSDAIPTTASLPRVTLWVERSNDNGGTWTALTGSRRRFRMRDTTPLCDPALFNGVPGVNQTAMWAQYDAPSTPVRWRVSFETLNGDFSFSEGRISVEILLS